MIENNKFVRDGRERLWALLEDALKEPEYSSILEAFPGAAEIVAAGFVLFALGAHTNEYTELGVEVDELPYFFNDTEPIPLGVLLGVKWGKLRRSSLSRVEASYLYYLDYKATLWDNGELRPWEEDELLAQEALLDWMSSDGKQTPSRETHLRGCLSKYYRAIQVCWEDGAGYEQLLEISPKSFQLPELGRGSAKLLPKSREEAVLKVLGDVYYFQLRERNAAFVSIRRIAEEEGIPYSEILKAFTLARREE